MSDTDETRLEDEEATTASEESDDTADVEGHKMHHGEAERVSSEVERPYH